MDNERKLLLCVLLQAIAEQEPRFVVAYKTNARDNVNKRKGKLAKEASDFVASAEFEEMARFAGIDPNYLRKGTSEQADRALKYFNNPATDYSAALALVLGLQDQDSESEAQAA